MAAKQTDDTQRWSLKSKIALGVGLTTPVALGLAANPAAADTNLPTPDSPTEIGPVGIGSIDAAQAGAYRSHHAAQINDRLPVHGTQTPSDRAPSDQAPIDRAPIGRAASTSQARSDHHPDSFKPDPLTAAETLGYKMVTTSHALNQETPATKVSVEARTQSVTPPHPDANTATSDLPATTTDTPTYSSALN